MVDLVDTENSIQNIGQNIDIQNMGNIGIEDLSCHYITSQIDVGSAHIVSIPTGAKIFIDYIGDTGLVTPAVIPDIPTGVHTYRLTYPGYTDVDGLLFINVNETYEVSVIMEISIPGYINPATVIAYIVIGGVLVYLSQILSQTKTYSQTRTYT